MRPLRMCRQKHSSVSGREHRLIFNLPGGAEANDARIRSLKDETAKLRENAKQVTEGNIDTAAASRVGQISMSPAYLAMNGNRLYQMQAPAYGNGPPMPFQAMPGAYTRQYMGFNYGPSQWMPMGYMPYSYSILPGRNIAFQRQNFYNQVGMVMDAQEYSRNINTQLLRPMDPRMRIALLNEAQSPSWLPPWMKIQRRDVYNPYLPAVGVEQADRMSRGYGNALASRGGMETFGSTLDSLRKLESSVSTSNSPRTLRALSDAKLYCEWYEKRAARGMTNMDFANKASSLVGRLKKMIDFDARKSAYDAKFTPDTIKKSETFEISNDPQDVYVIETPDGKQLRYCPQDRDGNAMDLGALSRYGLRFTEFGTSDLFDGRDLDRVGRLEITTTKFTPKGTYILRRGFAEMGRIDVSDGEELKVDKGEIPKAFRELEAWFVRYTGKTIDQPTALTMLTYLKRIEPAKGTDQMKLDVLMDCFIRLNMMKPSNDDAAKEMNKVITKFRELIPGKMLEEFEQRLKIDIIKGKILERIKFSNSKMRLAEFENETKITLVFIKQQCVALKEFVGKGLAREDVEDVGELIRKIRPLGRDFDRKEYDAMMKAYFDLIPPKERIATKIADLETVAKRQPEAGKGGAAYPEKILADVKLAQDMVKGLQPFQKNLDVKDLAAINDAIVKLKPQIAREKGKAWDAYRELKDLLKTLEGAPKELEQEPRVVIDEVLKKFETANADPKLILGKKELAELSALMKKLDTDDVVVKVEIPEVAKLSKIIDDFKKNNRLEKETDADYQKLVHAWKAMVKRREKLKIDKVRDV